ncbi:MAG: insulinase family protein, partial [Chloroflexales bacterium]
MTLTHGFTLVRDEHVAELHTRARIYRHAKTGAELLSLANDDENKCFGITFRTPPEDSTGVAHILEHSVLGGSRKYPVKDPFVELLKSSLKTFLNAFTYPDKTCYPVASTNLQDFYNLVDVYLDAVFFPRITPETLKQEGWHYELEQKGDPLIFKGVVFNEMKGAYSSPDATLGRYAQQSLFPNTTYGHSSGGDPRAIPDLSYAQFKAFHSTLYHPSNARIFFYGDDPEDERLRLLDAYLSQFELITPPSQIGIQAPFDAPRSFEHTYSADDDNGKKGMVTLNWLIGVEPDIQRVLTLDLLSYILIGNAGAPLRRALIDSGLGEDLTGGGYNDGLLQHTFSVGLKGIDPADATEVEALILRTLGDLAEGGIDADTIAAALNTFEFSLRENNTGSFPRGLSLMLRALGTWLYDGDPLAPLRFEAPLAAIRAALGGGERLFEGLIRSALLENQHRTRVLLRPDLAQAEREAAEERARLAAVRAAMSDADLEAVIAETHALK